VVGESLDQAAFEVSAGVGVSITAAEGLHLVRFQWCSCGNGAGDISAVSTIVRSDGL
jgi:hypothetical protein